MKNKKAPPEGAFSIPGHLPPDFDGRNQIGGPTPARKWAANQNESEAKMLLIQSTQAPIKILKAHSLAHLNLTAAEKAKFAASWIANRLMLLPTVELAATAFGVSQQLISQHRKLQSDASLAAGMLAFGLLIASTEGRDAVFAQYESLIWAGLERVTDAQH
jgi:hypothetical protein